MHTRVRIRKWYSVRYHEGWCYKGRASRPVAQRRPHILPVGQNRQISLSFSGWRRRPSELVSGGDIRTKRRRPQTTTKGKTHSLIFAVVQSSRIRTYAKGKNQPLRRTNIYYKKFETSLFVSSSEAAHPREAISCSPPPATTTAAAAAAAAVATAAAAMLRKGTLFRTNGQVHQWENLVEAHLHCANGFSVLGKEPTPDAPPFIGPAHARVPLRKAALEAVDQAPDGTPTFCPRAGAGFP
ncbi:unnamed protein product [Vitrella brassicaformis CCMP3155]|uniref:Uncharacterized protein n=1 Tax=Vitrella brassicaformis (strain CCMP3155) TaxID=1169540 RepID=A0A0G4EYC3_VITBC|nr:unnamed protein product [Vitrella brassicaformis CCMP3155]|eukprot:CEM03634.1 unnamed protein product [Vitrella brassicaformis CCMP3155]